MSRNYLFAIFFFVLIIVACSNSEYAEMVDSADASDSGMYCVLDTSEMQQDYLPLDDSEYPYAGIPRIVIKTNNFRKIKDRETDVPAQLQVWGRNAPESDVMNLTIRGRGNNTWGYPKKPYAIEFKKKQSILGMPESKKWVLLANYRDRTLIRNAVAFEIARKMGQEWTPQGRFVDVFLNGTFIGNYFFCEKIEVKRNRLALNEESFLLEFDTHFDANYKFKTIVGDYPVNLKYPKEPEDSLFNYIFNYINEIVRIVHQSYEFERLNEYIDMESFATYFIINEVTQNSEIQTPKSFFAYKNSKEKLKAGPVWDYDYATFNIKKKGLRNVYGFLYKDLKKDSAFKKEVRKVWEKNKDSLLLVIPYIDSLAVYLEESNRMNRLLWPRTFNYDLIGDEDVDYNVAIEMLKTALVSRCDELDILFRLF
ncbi:CotH kinase family protein [uncultured Fibrobacter sp.]|uniref:CotH kinase family protein n=1 Tax=uncultured Fibrobacter sp. TaxID=261512 RepID=UPI00260416BF|nr:CotH kinase family protein [uncultured Fibrobacter sp.]